MNNKEFTAELAAACGLSQADTAKQMEIFLSTMVSVWTDADSISVSGFGVLEVKKKNERISVNPGTGIRMLVPPKLVLTYKPSSSLKEKLK